MGDQQVRECSDCGEMEYYFDADRAPVTFTCERCGNTDRFTA